MPRTPGRLISLRKDKDFVAIVFNLVLVPDELGQLEGQVLPFLPEFVPRKGIRPFWQVVVIPLDPADESFRQPVGQAEGFMTHHAYRPLSRFAALLRVPDAAASPIGPDAQAAAVVLHPLRSHRQAAVLVNRGTTL